MLSPSLQKIVRTVKLCSLGVPQILKGDLEDIQEKDIFPKKTGNHKMQDQ